MLPHTINVSVMVWSFLVNGLADQLRPSEYRNGSTPSLQYYRSGPIYRTALRKEMTHAAVEATSLAYENAVCRDNLCLSTA